MIKSQVDVPDWSTLYALMRQAPDYWQDVEGYRVWIPT